MTEDEYIALTRFGLGIQPEIDIPRSQPVKALLKEQLQAPLFNDSLMSSKEAMIAFQKFKTARKRIKQTESKEEKSRLKREIEGLKSFPKEIYREHSLYTLQQATTSNTSINWRVFDLFSNHFSVTAGNKNMKLLAPYLEREAIAPNIYGHFEDLLIAVIQHPAMLIYLNNEQSIGPNSPIGKKRNKNINENLAREILELHTLGVDGGYSQTDVIELSKAITGWTLANPKRSQQVGFNFNRRMHEPGERQILGRRFKQSGVQQGEAIFSYLANHPKTAEHICRKIAQHFISDTPSDTLVEKLKTRWLKSNGNIEEVMHELIDAKESWQSTPSKFKTPREFYISAIRAANMEIKKERQVIFSLKELGQLPFQAGSPAGYEDKASEWLSPGAMLTRADWSMHFAQHWTKRVPSINKLVDSLFGQQISQHSRKSILRAESKQEALMLILMSPEFLKR